MFLPRKQQIQRLKLLVRGHLTWTGSLIYSVFVCTNLIPRDLCIEFHESRCIHHRNKQTERPNVNNKSVKIVSRKKITLTTVTMRREIALNNCRWVDNTQVWLVGIIEGKKTNYGLNKEQIKVFRQVLDLLFLIQVLLHNLLNQI